MNGQLLENVPLHCVEAEESFLGALFFLKRKSLAAAIAKARPEWFFLSSHRVILEAAKRVAIGKDQLDEVMLKSDLVSRGLLEHAGDEDKLIRIAERVPSPANWDHYLGIVRDNFHLRSLDGLGNQLHDLVRSGDEPTAVWQTALRSIKGLVSGSGTELINLAEIDLDAEPESGVPSGFESIDRTTGFLGFVTAQTSVVSAYHKGGKSAFMLQCAKFLMDRGKSVVYATFADLTAAQLKRRILKQMSGFSRPPESLQESADFEEAIDYLNDTFRDGSFRIYVGAQHGRYVEDLAAKLLEDSEGPDAVFVDYAQKLRSRERGARDSKTAELEYASDALKAMAEDCNCSVILGSQITRGERKGEQTTKYARGIEEDAGLVLNIGETDDAGRVTITVAYNRFGPSGVELPFRWDKHRVRFMVEKP